MGISNFSMGFDMLLIFLRISLYLFTNSLKLLTLNSWAISFRMLVRLLKLKVPGVAASG